MDEIIKTEPIFFKTIEDEYVKIRELDLPDLDDLFDLFSNKNVSRYMGFYEIKDKNFIRDMIIRIREEYANKTLFYLGVLLKKTNKIIGYIGLSRYDLTEKTAQVVYALNEDYWHQGLMAKALKLFVNYLFEIQKKEIIIATHIADNFNSGKVMEKCGFIRDQSFDRIMLIKGVNQKLTGYSITKERYYEKS